MAVVQEAYVNGVSTRKVDRLVRAAGLAGMSKDQVSRLCRGLDEQVTAFRERPLEGALPVPVARRQGRAGPRAAAACATRPGDRLRGARVGPARGDRPRRRRGRDRGLLARVPARARAARPGRRAARASPTPTRGCKAAIAQVLGCPWQRCTVHFLRDMLGHCPKAQQQMVAAAHPPGLRAPTGRGGPRAADRGRRAPGAGRAQGGRGCCWSAEDDLLAFYAFPREPLVEAALAPTRSSASTARSAGAPTSSGSSPTTPALIRLAGALLIEQNDEWLVGRRYLSEESLALVLEDQGDGAKEVRELTAA